MEIEISCRQLEGSVCTHEQSSFLFFFSEGGRDRDKFPKCSQVPKLFVEHSPRCSLLHLGLIPYGLPKVQLPLYKLNKVKSRGAHLFLFCNCGSKEVLLLGACPMFPKKLLIGQSIWLLKNKKRKLWAHPWSNQYESQTMFSKSHHQKFFFHYLPWPWIKKFQKNMGDTQAHLDPWIIHVLGV